MPPRTSTAGEKAKIELLIGILKLASLMGRPMRDAVSVPAGLSTNELQIFMALYGQGPSAGHDLAELMGMNAMNVSRALSALHAMGLIEPVNNADNRRRKPYRLSNRGRRAYAALQPDLSEVAEYLFGVLESREQKDLGRILETLDARIRDWQPGS
ncbi:MAG: MarR family winged helix-turn-helix transcriptional regulator [Gammaproteobacteria bacterium]